MKNGAAIVMSLVALGAGGVLPGQPAPSRIESKGVSVQVPRGWKCNDRLAAAAGPIACTNFTEPYANGGMLPPGGAEIEITSVPRPPALEPYARAELKGVRDLKLQESPAGGRAAIRSTYADQPAPGVSTQNVVYYVAQGNRLYKFYLTYHAGDARERELIRTLETVVSEAVLK
jgi:hypothetical protein